MFNLKFSLLITCPLLGNATSRYFKLIFKELQPASVPSQKFLTGRWLGEQVSRGWCGFMAQQQANGHAELDETMVSLDTQHPARSRLMPSGSAFGAKNSIANVDLSMYGLQRDHVWRLTADTQHNGTHSHELSGKRRLIWSRKVAVTLPEFPFCFGKNE